MPHAAWTARGRAVAHVHVARNPVNTQTSGRTHGRRSCTTLREEHGQETQPSSVHATRAMRYLRTRRRANSADRSASRPPVVPSHSSSRCFGRSMKNNRARGRACNDGIDLQTTTGHAAAAAAAAVDNNRVYRAGKVPVAREGGTGIRLAGRAFFSMEFSLGAALMRCDATSFHFLRTIPRDEFSRGNAPRFFMAVAPWNGGCNVDYFL